MKKARMEKNQGKEGNMGRMKASATKKEKVQEGEVKRNMSQVGRPVAEKGRAGVGGSGDESGCCGPRGTAHATWAGYQSKSELRTL